jgi:DNA-binding CsgD family transcriptional regulator
MKKYQMSFCPALSVFLISVFSFSLNGQQTSPFSIHNFTKQNYRAENQNWSITEDNNSYIYAANNIGLLEFDGIEWSYYPSPDGSIIRSVAVDSNNRIFTSGYRELGYWERDQLGALSYHSLKEKAEPWFIQNEEFWTIRVLNGKVYFHSFSSLFIYENDTFRIVRPGETINSIGEFNQKLLIHISKMGIYSVSDSGINPFITDEVIRKNPVRFMFGIDEEEFFIGTVSDGIYIYKNGVPSPYLPEWKDYFIKNEINRGAVMRDGRIIIGTILDGLSVFSHEGEFLYHINNAKGIQNNTILGIYPDKNDNIWLSLDRGIDFISFQSDKSFTIENANTVGAVYSAAVYNDKLFLGTNQGVFYRKWKSPDQEFTFLEGTQGQTWNCNVFEKNLFINHNNGTFLLNKDRIEKISVIGGGFSLIQNPKDPSSLVQSTYSNIVFYSRKGGKWQYSHLLGDFNNLIRYIEIDHLNNLWASHMHRGVYYLKMNDQQDSVIQERYYGTETFGKDHEIQVFQVENRVVFTTGNQIYTYDDISDTIIPYVQLNNFAGTYSNTHRIVAGPDHHYWLLSDKGIALFKIDGISFERIKEYPIELFKDHLIIGYENIIPLTALSGILCLDNGYAVLDAKGADLSGLISDKKMTVRSIEIMNAGGQSQNLNASMEKIRIPFNRNSLLIRYSFPMYSNEQVKFQSFVEGMDTGWSEPALKPEFSFKRLPPGEYTIKVKASNNWLKSSITNQLKITVAQPWYLNIFSLFIYFLLILAGAVLIRRIVINRMQLRVQKIRESKERELIRLRNEKLNSELSYKSQELANSTMSIIKKNEFLLEIKDILKGQKEELGLRYPDKYYQRLVRKIDSNISSGDDWKKFETHFERAHEKFLHKLMNTYPSLSHGDLRLCAYLRMNLSSKEIAPLLKISVRGVENHRYKLRKKLDLKPEVNLIDFILGL